MYRLHLPLELLSAIGVSLEHRYIVEVVLVVVLRHAFIELINLGYLYVTCWRQICLFHIIIRYCINLRNNNEKLVPTLKCTPRSTKLFLEVFHRKFK